MTKFKLPPMMRARYRNCKVYFFLEVNKNGQRTLKSLGSDYHEALAKYAKVQGGISDTNTFLDAWMLYKKDVLLKKAERTQKDNIKEVKHLLDFFNNAPLDQIKPYHIKKYLHKREAKVRANREIALFSHIFNYAREIGLIDVENPCRGISKNKEKGRKDIYVNDELYNKVYNCACQELKNAMDLAYLTAQRPADVLKMQWDDIWHENGQAYLFVQQNKTGKKQSFKINNEFQAILNRLDKNSKTLLGITAHFLKNKFDEARDLAGIDKELFQFKDLRAKAATDIAKSGGLKKAQSILGHSNEQMTRHYLRDKKGEIIDLEK